MGKQKKNHVDTSSTNELKSQIHDHSLFLDKLIELIPAKFYLPTDDKDKPWFQGLSKKEKANAKKESRENIKKARRDRLDPEKSNKSTLDLLKQNLEKEKSNEESDEEEIVVKPVLAGLEGDSRSVTYEELRQRLHKKIDQLRAGRNAGSSDDKPKKRNEKKRDNGKKRKREESGNEETTKATTSGSSYKSEKDVANAAKELAFSHVKLGNEEKHGKKKRKLSKIQELQRAQQLEEAKNDPEKGEIISKKHSWKAATSRAAGIKIHDDPKLLKRSMQKEKKKQQKNAEKWNERIETQHKMKAEKQQKRSENIADRVHQKKMRRIEKREKKLMRPGFEGRKDGFVNNTTT